jgi:hypothetical protein
MAEAVQRQKVRRGREGREDALHTTRFAMVVSRFSIPDLKDCACLDGILLAGSLHVSGRPAAPIAFS